MNSQYLEENVFMKLSKDTLKLLWEGYKRAVYDIGWYEHDNPMLPHVMYYQKLQGISGTKLCETLFLEAIAFKFMEEA